ncbi:MAG: STAS/SEC14 domain-containing protein [Bacteroidota bacterium]
MITIFPLSEPNMLGFTIDGQIDDEGLQRFLLAIEAKVTTHGKVRLLGNIKNLGGWNNFKTLWSKRQMKTEYWDHIEKYAVLTDSDILSSITGSVDWFTSGLLIKSFPLSAGEEAHQWLAEPMPEEPPPALRQIELANTRLLGLAIVGKLTDKDYELLDMLIEDQRRDHGKARIYLEIVDLEGISFRAIWQDLKTTVKHYSHIERIAIVGDQGWLKATIKVSDLMTPGLDMQAFPTEDRQRAMNWLG